MTDDIRNVFISHIHEDDEGIAKIKGLAEKHGMTVRNGSVTSDRPNSATNEDYIKYQILAPRIRGWIGKLSTPTARARGLSAYGNGERRSARYRKPSRAMATPSLDGTERAW